MQPIVRTSKGRKGRRRAHDAIKAVDTLSCPNCGSRKLPHRACGDCGYFRRGIAVNMNKEN